MSLLAEIHAVIDGLSKAGKLGPDEKMKPTEVKAMVALGMREPLTDAELAATIDADKAHFSRTIKSLIEQKYVEFLPSPKA